MSYIANNSVTPHHVDVAPSTPAEEWAQSTTSALDEGGHRDPLIPHFATTTTSTAPQDDRATIFNVSDATSEELSSHEKDEQAIADAIHVPVRPGIREEKTTIFNAHEKAILKAQERENEIVDEPERAKQDREELISAAQGKRQEQEAQERMMEASKKIGEAVGVAKEYAGAGYQKLPTAGEVQATTQNLAQGAQQVLTSAAETAKAYVPESVANYLPTNSTAPALNANSTEPALNIQPEHSVTSQNPTHTPDAFPIPTSNLTPAKAEFSRAQAHPETVPLPPTPAVI